jgi:hypothetical protein
VLPLVTYEMVRQLNEERRARSLKRFWWRYVPPEPTVTVPQSVQVADVIELVFGAHCETEESIGA